MTLGSGVSWFRSSTPPPAAGARRVHYLVGPSGHPNFGDELIAATWLRYLAGTEPDADVWLDTHSPGPRATPAGRPASPAAVHGHVVAAVR
ncbi:hypothetical protein [Amycolatopsis sp. cmx-4-83]|uniref:hypothetical protein n=1 Tax=Amycolatopsis sp. cmx-4-83 TaxID=2790940 RepID=UPI00397A4631